MTTPRSIRWAYWLLTLVLFVACLGMLRFYTPVEATMGPIQKVFYLHLPVAINTFVAAFVVCIASVGYLWQRSPAWDDTWWTWSPRLTFSLVLFLLYVVYVMIRPAIESPQRRAIVCAVYGIAAFIDVPVVYLSVKLMEDVHPSSITLAPEMKLTLLVWFVPVTLLMAGLIHDRYEVSRLLAASQARSGGETPESAGTTSLGESA
ncbi:MAG: cytochrome c biogenesis protein CcsA [Planctomycetota bacterium]|jgi:heme exporter protein C